MTQDYSGYYGRICTREIHGELLQRHGVVLGPYDAATNRFPAHVRGPAYDALVAFAAGQHGAFGLSFAYRQMDTLSEQPASSMDPETLRGEIALCRYQQAVECSTDYWAERGASCRRAYVDALQACGTLVRVAAEGEIELTTGAFGIEGAPADTITVRVFLDRAFGHNTARAMVIEQAVERDALAPLLGAEAARRVLGNFALIDTQSDATTLRDDDVPLAGALAERIRRRQWDAMLADRYPALDLLSVSEALALAERHLPTPRAVAAHVGTPEAQLQDIRAQSRTAKDRLTMSMAELAGFATALTHARTLLLASDGIGAKWADQRIGQLLDAQTPLRLKPQPSAAHTFVNRDHRYVIADEVPYAAAIPHTDMGEQVGGTFYWGLSSWVPTKREAATFDLHGAERELRALLPHCPRASLVPAEDTRPRLARRMHAASDLTL
ncbi:MULTISPECIES: hypothetical protein [Cupriavidus]